MASSKRPARRAERRAAARTERRTARARRSTAAQRRARRRARAGWIARQVAVAAVAAAILYAAVVLVRSATKGKPGTLPVATQVGSYAIDYRVVFTNGNVVNTDHHVVNRPFRSRYTTTRDGQLVTGSIVNDKGQWYFQAPNWHLINPGGSPASDDPQPTLALRAGIARHLARVIGARTVIGRRCTMVRTGSPLGEIMKKPTARNHTDMCVDSNDIILDYRWTLDGKVVHTFRALSLDLHPDVSDAVFTPTPASDSTPPVRAAPLVDQTRANLSPAFTPPADVTYAGGWVRIEQSGQSVAPRITTTELFLHGTDVVEFRYGLGEATPTGVEVRLPGGRLASLDLTTDRSTVTVQSGGQAVSLVGRDPDLLIRLAGSLVFG